MASGGPLLGGKGVQLAKFTHDGKRHGRTFKLAPLSVDGGDLCLVWTSVFKRKRDTRVFLKEVDDIIVGRGSNAAQRAPQADPRTCLSIVMTDGNFLDLVAKTPAEAAQFASELRHAHMTCRASQTRQRTDSTSTYGGDLSFPNPGRHGRLDSGRFDSPATTVVQSPNGSVGISETSALGHPSMGGKLAGSTDSSRRGSVLHPGERRGSGGSVGNNGGSGGGSGDASKRASSLSPISGGVTNSHTVTSPIGTPPFAPRTLIDTDSAARRIQRAARTWIRNKENILSSNEWASSPNGVHLFGFEGSASQRVAFVERFARAEAMKFADDLVYENEQLVTLERRLLELQGEVMDLSKQRVELEQQLTATEAGVAKIVTLGKVLDTLETKVEKSNAGGAALTLSCERSRKEVRTMERRFEGVSVQFQEDEEAAKDTAKQAARVEEDVFALPNRRQYVAGVLDVAFVVLLLLGLVWSLRLLLIGLLQFVSVVGATLQIIVHENDGVIGQRYRYWMPWWRCHVRPVLESELNRMRTDAVATLCSAFGPVLRKTRSLLEMVIGPQTLTLVLEWLRYLAANGMVLTECLLSPACSLQLALKNQNTVAMHVRQFAEFVSGSLRT